MRRQFPEEHSGWLKDLFQGLDEAARARLMEAGVGYVLEEGERLEPVRNSVVRVESGLVKLAVTSNERSLAVALFGSGHTLCGPLFHAWDGDLYYVQAQERSEVRVIPQQVLLEVAAQNPELSRNLMEQLSWGSWALMNTIHMLAFYNLPQRVAQVLVNLTEMFGIPNEKGGLKIGLRFTQEELAELAGARRETLSTVLQAFREDDVLDLRYARIDVKNLEALKQIAGSDALPFLNPAAG